MHKIIDRTIDLTIDITRSAPPSGPGPRACEVPFCVSGDLTPKDLKRNFWRFRSLVPGFTGGAFSAEAKCFWNCTSRHSGGPAPFDYEERPVWPWSYSTMKRDLDRFFTLEGTPTETVWESDLWKSFDSNYTAWSLAVTFEKLFCKLHCQSF